MCPTRPALAALALLAVLTTACQPAEPTTPAATIAAPSATPTTTPAPEPSLPSPSPAPEDYAVPAVIDEPYVQRVLQALYSLESEAVRQMVAAGEVTEEAAALLRAANRPVRIDPLLERYRGLAAQGFPGVLEEPGNQVVTVTIQDEAGLNPTPWMLAGGEVRTDGATPEDPCMA